MVVVLMLFGCFGCLVLVGLFGIVVVYAFGWGGLVWGCAFRCLWVC